MTGRWSYGIRPFVRLARDFVHDVKCKLEKKKKKNCWNDEMKIEIVWNYNFFFSYLLKLQDGDWIEIVVLLYKKFWIVKFINSFIRIFEANKEREKFFR